MRSLRQLFTVPNLMSLVRVPLAGLVWLAPTSVTWVLSLMAIAGVSDVLDGALARRQGLDPDDVGAWLDPLCDKVFAVSTLVAVWLASGPPWWWGAMASLREVSLFPLVLARFVVPSVRRRRFQWKATLVGKATTVTQFALFVAVLCQVRAAWWPLVVACAVLGTFASAHYAARAFRLIRAPESNASG